MKMIANRILFKITITLGLFFLCYNLVMTQNLSERTNPYSVSDTRYRLNLQGKWDVSYDGSSWKQGYVPSSESYYDKLYLKRIIRIDEKMLDNYSWHLYFMGVDDQIEVFCNDQFVDKYFGGTTPFEVRLPRRMLNGGANQIKLVLSAGTHTAQQLKVQSLYPRTIYTGILRDVMLVGLPHSWISDVRYNAKHTGGANFSLNMNVSISSGDIQRLMKGISGSDSLSAPGTVRNSITLETNLRSADGSLVLAQGGQRHIVIERERSETVAMQIPATNVKLWSPDEPYLYKLQVKISKGTQTIDELWFDVGFRKVQSDKSSGKFILNGKELQLKGVSYVEDYYGSGQTLSRKKMETDVEMIKTLGANLIRFKYSSPHPYMAYLCDKYGIFMMVELPVYEAPASLLVTDEIKVRMNNISRRYLAAYDNHPSLMAWGISDGSNEDAPEFESFSKIMENIFLENSKNLLYKIVLSGVNKINADKYDFIGLRIERTKFNIEKIKSEISRIKQLAAGVPVFLNFGFPIEYQNRNGYSDPLSIEAQAYYILNLYYVSTDQKFAGIIYNTFNDFKLNNPTLIINNDDKYLCSKGLVNRKREQRLAFTTLQSLFNNDKKPLLTAGSYTERTPVLFIIAGIILGIILVLLINRFRRFREYLFRSILRPYNFYADIRDQRIMSSLQTVILGFIVAMTLGIFVASVFYFYRTNILSQYLIMLILPNVSLQEWLYWLIWVPELFMMVLTFLILLVAYLIAGLLKLLSFFVRVKIFLSDTFTIVIWSGVPIILLLPLSIVLTRLLIYSPELYWLMIAISLGICLWVWFRILKSTAVVFDIDQLKVNLIGNGILFGVIIIIITIYQLQYLIFPYFGFFFNVLLRY